MSSSVPTTPIDYKALVQDDRIHASLYGACHQAGALVRVIAFG